MHSEAYDIFVFFQKLQLISLNIRSIVGPVNSVVKIRIPKFPLIPNIYLSTNPVTSAATLARRGFRVRAVFILINNA